MEQPSRNEGRLDDLNRKVDDGIGRLDHERRELRGELRAGFEKVDRRFEKVNEEFRSVRTEMKEGFEKVDQRFDKIDKRFAKVNEEFTAVRSEMHAGFAQMQWTLVGAAAVVIGALIGAPHL